MHAGVTVCVCCSDGVCVLSVVPVPPSKQLRYWRHFWKVRHRCLLCHCQRASGSQQEIPTAQSPLVLPVVKGEGQRKRERENGKFGQGLSSSLKVPGGALLPLDICHPPSAELGACESVFVPVGMPEL